MGFWLGQALVGLVAALHLGFLVLEMFVWNTPAGRKLFGATPEFADQAAAIMANQGLYNGFLAAGLAWSLLLGTAPHAFGLKVFFLGCVIVAGVYGAVTVKPTIALIQALPAALALLAVLAGQRG
ncbi:MAG: DUF1304 domain-containing protein [Candidatus Sericytochromatia bacterium]|nr:DUF1304 domain-containing protein [Candidatus Tanganyikabacteria bacterium]